jgi:hypothetical protein
MTCLTWTRWHARLLLPGAAALLALIALTTASSPAQARGWVSVGPCCGYWGPGPYWGYPPPYAYYPPPAYYPPAPYPAPGAYPPPAPTGYTPGTPAVPTATAAPAVPSAARGQPQISYTSKPAFSNSAGQTCREYKANDGGRDVFGTACRQTDGQWRVVN